MTRAAQIFELPERLAAKDDTALVGADQEHLAAVGRALEETITELSARLDDTRRRPARGGQDALDRDQEVHRLSARLRTLRRFGLDLCLGRMVLDQTDIGDEGAGGAAADRTVYVGRLGLTDSTGRRLLVDWRSPAAEPFFGATHANPMGLASRRRYRWARERITDYWDEVFTPDGLQGHAALDDQSAFIASLGSNRSPRMRDVLGTIQSDQDAIIRAGSRGFLVVDGGPGTGKTVVALHRSAYLLYSDPRLGHHRGGVLFVGPHQPYLAYVADVLPSLGEEGVQTCTLRDLVPEGVDATQERDPQVAALKSSAQMVDAIEAAVRFSEEPPDRGLTVSGDWAEIPVTTSDWAEAFDSAPTGVPHNEAREHVLDALLDILVDKVDAATSEEDEQVQPEALRRSLRADEDLTSALNAAWPLLDPGDVVGDLWTVPAYLRLCAPWLAPEEVRALQRVDAHAWTEADLPLLDAARHRLGDAGLARDRHRREAQLAAQREEMDWVVEHLVATDDSEMQVMSMLRVEDLQGALVDEAGVSTRDPDRLAGPFAHVVVDEAQELTDAQWQMLLVRCPSRSFTVVGDRAQARHGFTESWRERLERVGLERGTVSTLSINYRTPEEVMAQAEPVIRAALPDANVPVSVRSTGIPVSYGEVSELGQVVDDWLAAHEEGVACVIGDPTFSATSRVQSLTPQLAKGLEFDLVVLVDRGELGAGIEGAVERGELGAGIEGAVDRYVSMTRATQQLVILGYAGCAGPSDAGGPWSPADGQERSERRSTIR